MLCTDGVCAMPDVVAAALRCGPRLPGPALSASASEGVAAVCGALRHTMYTACGMMCGGVNEERGRHNRRRCRQERLCGVWQPKIAATLKGMMKLHTAVSFAVNVFAVYVLQAADA